MAAVGGNGVAWFEESQQMEEQQANQVRRNEFAETAVFQIINSFIVQEPGNHRFKAFTPFSNASHFPAPSRAQSHACW
jgi:hypothetical protein